MYETGRGAGEPPHVGSATHRVVVRLPTAHRPGPAAPYHGRYCIGRLLDDAARKSLRLRRMTVPRRNGCTYITRGVKRSIERERERIINLGKKYNIS